MPVEIRRVGGDVRWFRMAVSVSSGQLMLASGVPEAVDGPLQVAFHLPGDAVPIRVIAEAQDVVVRDGETEWAERKQLVFLQLSDTAQTQITHYIEESLA